MKTFEEILKFAKENGPKKIAVAAAHDKDVLIAIKMAMEEKIVNPILIGQEKAIREISEEINLSLENVEVINEEDLTEACRTAVLLVSSKKADILMKGLVDTSIILKAVLDKEIGLRTGNVLSNAAVFATEKYHKIFMITDPAINISPNANEKAQILENALELFHSLGVEEPKVAVVCAKEKVSNKMQATLDAEELVKMYKEGRFTGCIVEGPYALDNAISKEAAEHKGISGKVAGDADILLMPAIEAGNIFYKALTYLANSENAGIVLGARAPIVLTSRADKVSAKLNSIALAVLGTIK